MPPAFAEKEKSAQEREGGWKTVPVKEPEKKIPPKAGPLAEKIRQKYGTDSEERFFLQKVAPYLGMKYCRTGAGSNGKQGINCANLVGRALYGIGDIFFTTNSMHSSSAIVRLTFSQLSSLKPGDALVRPKAGSKDGHAAIVIANEPEQKRAVIAEAGSNGVVLRYSSYDEIRRTFENEKAIGIIPFENAAVLVAELWSMPGKTKGKAGKT